MWTSSKEQNPNIDNLSSAAKAKLPVTLAKLEGQMHRAYPQGLVQSAGVAPPLVWLKTADVCSSLQMME